MSAIGIPQRPNPPTARLAPSGMSATAAAAVGKTLSIGLEIHEVLLPGPQPRELDEVLGVEEQLVELGHVVDGESLRPADEVVEVLEGILGAVSHMVGTHDLARLGGDDELEPSGQLRIVEGVQH